MNTRHILLVEPAYKNKYPPINLMKLATYFKLLGDKVTFYKGNIPKLYGKHFDMVCVATLFTFYWNLTIRTILQCKNLSQDVRVGGVLATVQSEELYAATGIMPHKGLLKPGDIDKDNDIDIDKLPLDYSILDQIDYKYVVSDAYIGYMTRGCVNHCVFCAVGTLEPEYVPYVGIREQLEYVAKHFGTRKDLLLLDNNVLASDSFERIVDEIKSCGFGRGAKLVNERHPRGASRFVDFNQGIDARLVTREKMAKLAELNIRPLRLAFDCWQQRSFFETAVNMAAEHGIKTIASYMLYNFQDKPEEMYARLKLGVELANKFKVRLYSFPMKYHPLEDHDRKHIGPYWNRKFIRTIQIMLNATKGKVGTGEAFFNYSFGRNLEEFKVLLWMPERYLLFRKQHEAEAAVWKAAFNSLRAEKRNYVESIVGENDFRLINLSKETDTGVRNVLMHYLTKQRTDSCDR